MPVDLPPLHSAEARVAILQHVDPPERVIDCRHPQGNVLVIRCTGTWDGGMLEVAEDAPAWGGGWHRYKIASQAVVWTAKYTVKRTRKGIVVK